MVEGREGLLLCVVGDFALRQRLLQFGHTHLCYFGASQAKRGELFEFDHLLEALVCYFGACP